METKYTPGPWVFHGQHQEIHAAVDEDGSQVIADMNPDNDYPRETNAANARLIAAAPELLAALQALTATARTFRNVPKGQQEWTALDDEALNAAFSAIAKATQ